MHQSPKVLEAHDTQAWVDDLANAASTGGMINRTCLVADIGHKVVITVHVDILAR